MKLYRAFVTDTTTAKLRSFSPALSAYLDLLRFGAAMIVMLAHFSYPRYTEDRYTVLLDLNLGSDAVIIFFVLSGFVITYAAICRDKTSGGFAFSRLTRLWSVAIPAVILTLVLDRLGVALRPDNYVGQSFYNAENIFEQIWRSLTFTSQWSSENIRLGTNGPYWSLSYEAAYYAAFAICFFLRGIWRIALLVLLCALVGVNVLLLAPAWVMGAFTFWLLHRKIPDGIPTPVKGALAVIPILLYVFFLKIGMMPWLRDLTIEWLGWETFKTLNFSDEFIWDVLLGFLFSLHIFGTTLLLSGRVKPLVGSRAIKWLAGGSFSLYLVHYPTLQFTSSVLPKSGVWWVDDVALIAITLSVCYLVAELFERPLGRYRKWILAARR